MYILIFFVRWFQPTDSFLKTTSVIENIPLGLVASVKTTFLEKQFPLEQFSIIFFGFFIFLSLFVTNITFTETSFLNCYSNKDEISQITFFCFYRLLISETNLDLALMDKRKALLLRLSIIWSLQ